jgi:hypothetical protein
MAKAPKTTRTTAPVSEFLDAIVDAQQRRQARRLASLMRAITGERPAMWGSSIIGYGEYAARSGPWPRIGFSSRKGTLVVYLMPGTKTVSTLLERLGPHTTGSACLYVKSLEAVDEAVLREVITQAWKAMAEQHPEATSGATANRSSRARRGR